MPCYGKGKATGVVQFFSISGFYKVFPGWFTGSKKAFSSWSQGCQKAFSDRLTGFLLAISIRVYSIYPLFPRSARKAL